MGEHIMKIRELAEIIENDFPPCYAEEWDNVGLLVGNAEDDIKAILTTYLTVYDPADDKDTWFAKIKDMCEPLGFTPNVKEYKKNPEAYKGHVGDVSGVIRMAVTSRSNTPDLCAIMQLLGKDEVTARISNAISTL